jgi:hypothetical protein
MFALENKKLQCDEIRHRRDRDAAERRQLGDKFWE